MKKKVMRSAAAVLTFCLAVSTFAGCGSKTEETKAAETEKSGSTETASLSENGGKDTLILATANETPSVTTHLHSAVAGDYINKMTHNGLFKTDKDLNVIPDLCESYEILSDTEWQFKIYQGVKFHNGEEMKAEDVKASIELAAKSPEVAQNTKSIASIEVVDDYTVKITTDGPQSGLLSDLTSHGNFILPKKLIDSGHDFNKEPIGTGPYKMTAWNKGESIELERFDDYFGEPAKIKTVIWKIIPEGSSRTMALEAGEVDLIVEVETTDVSRMRENPDIKVFDEAGTSHNYMMINNEIAPFNNRDFRRALNAAIDKEAIVQVALNGAGSACASMVPSCFPGATDEGCETYNPERAQELLASSGLNAADCGFTIICSDDAKLRAGQVIQSSLKENLGIDVQLESMDLATYLDVTATGDYEAAIGGYTATTMLSYVIGVYHSDSINASNKTRINNPEIDALIEKMQATLDPEENVKVATEMCLKVNEECPQVPLYMRNNTRAYSAKISGFNCSAGGTTYYNEFSWN